MCQATSVDICRHMSAADSIDKYIIFGSQAKPTLLTLRLLRYLGVSKYDGRQSLPCSFVLIHERFRNRRSGDTTANNNDVEENRQVGLLFRVIGSWRRRDSTVSQGEIYTRLKRFSCASIITWIVCQLPICKH